MPLGTCQLDEPRATLAFNQYPHGAVRKLQQLDDARNDAKIIKVVARRIILGRV